MFSWRISWIISWSIQCSLTTILPYSNEQSCDLIEVSMRKYGERSEKPLLLLVLFCYSPNPNPKTLALTIIFRGGD